MWFIKGSPTLIHMKALIESIEYGYQKNRLIFSIESDNEELYIGIAVPWAPHKENGGITIIEEEGIENIILKKEDLKIFEAPRQIKKEANIELIHVQDLMQWYCMDDIGIITAHIQAGKTYQISYIHKIASDSRLFFPTKLPTIIASKKPKMDYILNVKNGLHFDLPEWLVLKVSIDNMVSYAFKSWDWDDDTRIHTDNWASSSDEEDN